MKIYADFNNADSLGRLRLNTNGTIADLERLGVSFIHGLSLELSDGELLAGGSVEYSDAEGIWVAVIDWKKVVDVRDT
jgi:hypothetical protein